MKKFYLITILLLTAQIGSSQNLSGVWSGLLDTGLTKLHLAFHIQKDASGNEICWMDTPDQGVKGIPTSLIFLSSDSLSVDIPMIQAKYHGKLIDEAIKGTFEQMGNKLSLDLTNNALQYRRPQNPTLPYPYPTEEVAFENVDDGVVLAGTLTFPKNYKKGQKVPVVLMVTGSGIQNRDEEIFEHKPFLVIADYLAKNGIASLRYDDRAVGKSTGLSPTINTQEVADDAKMGVKYLRGRHEFSKVGLLGHSEGASVAFMLGADHLLDFVISMAGAGVKGDECLYFQAKKVAELADRPFSMTKEQFVQMALAKPSPWLEFFFNYDPAGDIRQTTCPVLALNGEKDCQVISSLNLTAIEQHLPENKFSEVKSYPGLNHLFQECQVGTPEEYSSIEQTICPIVLQDVVEWIHSL